jgi:septal ring factor EnvC (AmiA/AmiB activator)
MKGKSMIDERQKLEKELYDAKDELKTALDEGELERLRDENNKLRSVINECEYMYNKHQGKTVIDWESECSRVLKEMGDM